MLLAFEASIAATAGSGGASTVVGNCGVPDDSVSRFSRQTIHWSAIVNGTIRSQALGYGLEIHVSRGATDMVVGVEVERRGWCQMTTIMVVVMVEADRAVLRPVVLEKEVTDGMNTVVQADPFSSFSESLGLLSRL